MPPADLGVLLMSWQNDNLVLYHGCTDRSLYDPQLNPTGIRTGTLPHGLAPEAGNPARDFGKGFYTTSSFDQARDWANVVIRRNNNPRRKPGRGKKERAVVFCLEVSRNDLTALEALVFVNEDVPPYGPFVRYCRRPGPP